MSFYNFSSKPTGNNIKKSGTSAKDGKTLPVDYIPKRFGLKYDPPTISLFFFSIRNISNNNSSGIYA